jgi:hypothetical protein
VLIRLKHRLGGTKGCGGPSKIQTGIYFQEKLWSFLLGRSSGTYVMILKIFSLKNSAKIGVFYSKQS